MKLSFGFKLLSILVIGGILLAASIIIQSPGPGNNVWTRGTKRFIKWRQPKNTGNLTLILRRNNQDVGIIKDTYTPTGGTLEMYHWVVGDMVTGKAPVAKNYRIRIKIKEKPDFSDSQPFEIKSPL